MRNWSFFLTTEQVRQRSKTVTRRALSPGLPKVGEIRQPVVKMQGIKKGDRVAKIGGPVRILDVRVEPLNAITHEDCAKEGFPSWTPAQFVAFYREHSRGRADQTVARIEFEYLP